MSAAPSDDSPSAISAPPALVMVRHGQSAWNRDDRFTGWEDPPLTAKGRAEARRAAQKMRKAGMTFDAVFVSYLRRATETLWLIQQKMDLMWLPVASDWRLNERHYGGLQGLNKTETAARHGAEQVRKWRRGYDTRPPKIARDGNANIASDHRYAGVELPRGESLADTRARAVACYEARILPMLQSGKRVLIVAHGNSLRSLVMHIGGISADDIMRLEIPTGGATAYRADSAGTPRPPHIFVT